jgi:hypothetical protein
MSNTIHMFNQFIWLLAMIATFGLIVLAWKRPMMKQVEALAVVNDLPSKPVEAENTLMIVHVRKIHTPGTMV